MTGELPVGAWLQMFEDSVPDLRMVVREYGILVTTKDRVPQGALTVQDFWNAQGYVHSSTDSSDRVNKASPAAFDYRCERNHKAVGSSREANEIQSEPDA